MAKLFRISAGEPAPRPRPTPSTGERTGSLAVLAAIAVVAAGVAGLVAGREDAAPDARLEARNAARVQAGLEQDRYLRLASATLARLDSRRVSGRRALAAARTPSRQTASALGLASAYRGAYRRLKADSAAVPGATRLVVQLRRGSLAYRRLAHAVARRRARSYRAARRAIRTTEAQLARTMAAMGRSAH